MIITPLKSLIPKLWSYWYRCLRVFLKQNYTYTQPTIFKNRVYVFDLVCFPNKKNKHWKGFLDNTSQFTKSRKPYITGILLKIC